MSTSSPTSDIDGVDAHDATATSDGVASGECRVDSDCPSGDSACLAPACIDEACALRPAPDFIPCDDNDRCTIGDVCVSGECIPGQPRTCPQQSECVDVRCDALTGCVSSPKLEPLACDDGDPCTESDMCTDGSCQGEPKTECACAQDADCSPFEDANLCNGTLRCVAGFCEVDPETLISCEDAGPCLSSVCVAATGACITKILPDGLSCNDYDPCTTGDTCTLGICRGTSSTCTCSSDDDCSAVQGPDYNLCLGPLRCSGGVCVPDVSAAVKCEFGDQQDTCTTSLCSPQSGLCISAAMGSGTACNTGDLCAPGGTCQFGECTPKPATVPCDDNNVCTKDYCDPSTGCYHTPYPASSAHSCNDGDPCTAADFCNDGACVPGESVCDDNNPCTLDTCNANSLECAHQVVDDGTACADPKTCFEAATCISGVCTGEQQVTCDDGNPCTDDFCDENVGCIALPVVEEQNCDDGNACTQLGQCIDGSCKALPISCNDGLPCTIDDCVPDIGCVSQKAPDETPCDVDDPCVAGAACLDGLCKGGVEVACDSGPCETRECDPNTGACEVASYLADATPCGDETPCAAAPICEQGTCIPGTLKCDDNDPCTVDLCAPESGACNHKPVICPHGPNLCEESKCVSATGSCEKAPVTLCDSATLIFQQSFTCLVATTGQLGEADWSYIQLAGDVGFAVDSEPSGPPPALDDKCTLNINDGETFLSSQANATHAAAVSPPFGQELSVVAAAPPSLQLRFWQWWDTELSPDVDRRFVALLDAQGTVLEEVLLPKTGNMTWTATEVIFAPQQPPPYRVRFRFNSVDADANGGKGWFIDRILVALP